MPGPVSPDGGQSRAAPGCPLNPGNSSCACSSARASAANGRGQRTRTMLAAQTSAFGRPDEVIELIEQPDPGEPGVGEVVIDTELFPINPADLVNLEGKYGATRPSLPM